MDLKLTMQMMDGTALIKAYLNDLQIGYLHLLKRRGYWTAQDVGVDPPHRRRGVATAMYNHAEENGMNIEPSEAQTSDAEAFWRSRRS